MLLHFLFRIPADPPFLWDAVSKFPVGPFTFRQVLEEIFNRIPMAKRLRIKEDPP
jgi:hypothetical protein